MKIHKILYTFLCLGSVLAVTAITSCQHKTAGEKTEKKEYTKLVVVSSGSYDQVPDFQEVEKKVNDITRKKLGVEVEFETVDSFDYENAVELKLTSGEQVDILVGSNALFMKNYINRQLCDLEPLLKEYGQGIIDAVGWDYINCCRIGGTLYGLPNNRDYAAGWDSYALRQDILEKYDISVDDIKTIDDLEKIFGMIKEKEPDLVPVACSGSMFNNFALADGINSFPAGGHTNYGQDEELVNIFETDEYMNRLKQVRRWYLKGYLGSNPIENNQGTISMMRNGEAFAMGVKNKPGIETQESLRVGKELKVVQFGETTISYNSMAAFPWTITKNTVSKELSMKLLNLMYTDADIMNLLAYGIEGEDYVKTEDGHITLPEGKVNNPYSGMAWRLPNQFITYVWEGDALTLWDDMRKYNKNALKTCEIGFNFNVFPVAKEYLKLEEIYNAYKPVLESGMVNPEVGVKQMMTELNQNGLDTVITEKRRQYETWKMANK